MRTETRSSSFALILILATNGLVVAEDATSPPRRAPVQLADRRLRELPERPRAVVHSTPGAKEIESINETPDPEPQPQATADPYGFAAILNAHRASAGLHPLAYDPELSNWAAHNNAAQARRGLGHHVLPNCFQNCGWNYADAWSVAQGWMNSPGHRRNMLAPSTTRFGIAHGPGPYWTLNAR